MAEWHERAGESPVAARMAWLLEATSGRALSAEEMEHEFALPALADQVSTINRVNGPWPVASFEDYEQLSPTYARLHLVGADGHRRALRVGVEAESPHRIRYASRFHSPADVVVRAAVDADAAALVALESRTPVVDAGVERRYERSDWFGQLRLMNEVIVVVAEIDDEIVGVHVDAVRATRLDGHDYRLLYRFRTRVDPRAQGRYVFPALNGLTADIRVAHASVGWGVDSEDIHVAIGNEHMRAVAAGYDIYDWATPIERLVIDCAAAAGPPAGRPATADDASAIAAILSRGRGPEAGYPETTAASIAERFSRAGATYGWADLLVSDEAVLGIWDEQTSMTTVIDGVEHHESHAIAADYGCVVGHEDQLIALVRAACATLAARGVTHLVVHTSAPARHRKVLFSLAQRCEQFSRKTRVPEPPLAVTNGVYVDPIYF